MSAMFPTCSDCLCWDCLQYWSARCEIGCEPKCKGGVFYPKKECAKYVHYTGQQVKECLKANVQIFQDGYIRCCLIDNYGCAKCYEEFEEAHNESI